MTKEDLEEASEGGDKEDRFEGGCSKLSLSEKTQSKQLQKKCGESGHFW